MKNKSLLAWINCKLALVFAFFLPRLVYAAGTVTNCDWPSLQTALNGGGTVTFACDGTITLTNTITITNDMVLDATGHRLIIDGNNSVRLFYVTNGATLTLIHLTLANGRSVGANGIPGDPKVDGEPGYGGAIYNDQGNVNLVQCSLLNNVAAGGNGVPGLGGPVQPAPNGNGGHAFGGAVYSYRGQLNVTNSTLLGNQARGGTGANTSLWPYPGGGGNASGGAIFIINSVVNLSGTVFRNNISDAGEVGQGRVRTSGGRASGGALYLGEGSVTISGGGFWSNQTIGKSRFSGFGADPDGGSSSGGAIFQAVGELQVSGTVFDSNVSTGGYGTVVLLSTGPDGNANGGGLCILGGTVTVQGCTLAMNRAAGTANGGGFCNLGGTATVRGCSFVMNRASGLEARGCCGLGDEASGGAIYNRGVLWISNCSFAENVAHGQDQQSNGQIGGSAYGGGIFSLVGTVSLVNATLMNNDAFAGTGTNVFSGQGGSAFGAAIYSIDKTMALTNTIVATTAAGTNIFGTIIDGGHNLCSDSSANFTSPTSLSNTDPLLAPLADNGGPTPTMALLPGSPAIDAGDDSACPPTDQRGVPRPIGAHCDIGAFEFVPAPFLIRGPTGNVRVQYVFQPGRIYNVQASSNLGDWINIGNATSATNGGFEFKDLNAIGLAQRFYRITTP